MDEVIEFFVPGLARPAGSKRAFVLRRKDGSYVQRAGGAPAVVVTDDAGKAGKDWRGDVRRAAADAYRGPLLEGAVWLCLMFVMPRPKSHYTTRGLRPTAPKYHTSKPDATKLLRSVEDALTGVLWHDDSAAQIDSVVKIYGDAPGVHVRIWPAEDAKAPAEPEPSLFETKKTKKPAPDGSEDLDDVLAATRQEAV